MTRIIDVDAFTERQFAGNPAAVSLLEKERDAKWMQAVARGGIIRVPVAGERVYLSGKNRSERRIDG